VERDWGQIHEGIYVEAERNDKRRSRDIMTKPDEDRASEWVIAHLARPPPGQRPTLLDVACGRGRNLFHGLQLGYTVTGVDRDLAGVTDLAAVGRVELVTADLEDGSPWPFGTRMFDVVIVTNYLHRPVLPAIVAAVAPSGCLIYETFAAGQALYGSPSNPDFLLGPGELLDTIVGKLMPVSYDHSKLTQPDRLVQRIYAVGPDHPFLKDASAPSA
jgi:SAM-dependent methyltransferase